MAIVTLRFIVLYCAPEWDFTCLSLEGSISDLQKFAERYRILAGPGAVSDDENNSLFLLHWVLMLFLLLY